jgi:hypothetical protein
MSDIPDTYTADRSRALQAKQQELERQQNTDSLRKHLEKRPEREELVERTLPQFNTHILVTDDEQETSSPKVTQPPPSPPTRNPLKSK